MSVLPNPALIMDGCREDVGRCDRLGTGLRSGGLDAPSTNEKPPRDLDHPLGAQPQSPHQSGRRQGQEGARISPRPIFSTASGPNVKSFFRRDREVRERPPPREASDERVSGGVLASKS